MKATLDHVGIVVQDLDRALQFFRDALGLEVAAAEAVAGQRVRVTEVATGGASLEFLESPAQAPALGLGVGGEFVALDHVQGGEGCGAGGRTGSG